MTARREHRFVALILAILLATAACARPAAPTASPAGPATAANPTPASVVGQPGTRVTDPSVSESEGSEPDLEGDESGSTAESEDPAPSEPAIATDPGEPFAFNLYQRGDFVAQYTFEWCVGASIQMAINMATKESTTTRPAQQEFWEMARDRSFSPFGGANPRGWVATLNEEGVGPYELVSVPTFDEALQTAAAAIRATERPVGLVMWRGRHAWVMSGFTSTADPRTHDDFAVTGVRVLDPLYPHGSSLWGPSPKPNTLMEPSVLDDQFVVRDRGRVNLGVPPGFLLVLPVSA